MLIRSKNLRSQTSISNMLIIGDGRTVHVFICFLPLSSSSSSLSLLDAFEPAFGGPRFHKSRGATQVHHAAKSVNQIILSADAIATFLAKKPGRRVKYRRKTEFVAKFVGFLLWLKNLIEFLN